MKTIEDRILAAIQKHGPNVRKIRHNLKNAPPREEVEAIIVKLGYVVDDTQDTRPQAKTLATFRDAHDYASRISEAIAEHCAGELYLTEAELRQVAEVPSQLWRRYADLPEFEAHRFTYKGITYWGRETTIRSMREIVKGL
jgi:hypothetical protein